MCGLTVHIMSDPSSYIQTKICGPYGMMAFIYFEKTTSVYSSKNHLNEHVLEGHSQSMVRIKVNYLQKSLMMTTQILLFMCCVMQSGAPTVISIENPADYQVQ